MKKKESLWLKYLRFSSGIPNKMSKEQWAEFQRIESNAQAVFMALTTLIIVASIILVGLKGYEAAYITLLIGILIAIIGIGIYESRALGSLGVYDVKVTSGQRKKAILKIIFKSLLSVIFYLVIYYLVIFLLDGGTISSVWHDNWVQFLVIAVAAFAGRYSFLREHLKIV